MIRTRAKHAAMAHQKVSLAHDEKNSVVLDLSDGGSGKTFVRVIAFAKRRKKGGGCMLVLCPRSLMRVAWANDFQKFAPELKVQVVTAEKRDKELAVDADVYITNHDSTKWLVKQKPAFWKKFSELVIDEPPAYKHHTSQRAKAARAISKHFTQRKGLTATPTSNGICDIWHQMLILDGGKRLGNSFYAFRNSVCTPQQVGFHQHAIKWQDKDGAEEAVYGLLNDIVVRHSLDDCSDIPPTHFYTLPYTMTPKQQKLYDDMEQKNLLQLNSGTMTAVHAAAVVQKLIQITSGAVYTGNDKYEVLDTSRYELILDLCQARKHPIVFFFWKHQRDLLIEEAEKRGMNWALIDGESTDAEVAQVEAMYQASKYDVLFAHPKCVAHGFTLTAGTSTIWPCPTPDLEWFKQGSMRQRRIGQKHKTEVITLVTPGTREEEIYDQILMPKEKRMSNFLSLVVQGMSELEAA